MEQTKQVHSLILDAGPIIKNAPAVSTIIGHAESIVTVPAVISEIKDAATRSRVETTLQPFLTLRTPSPASIKVVTDFARRTGDLAVLSKPDIQIIALTYEIECERNHGDWRLRKVPGQKGLNGAPPSKSSPEPAQQKSQNQESQPTGDASAVEQSPAIEQESDNPATVVAEEAPEETSPQSVENTEPAINEQTISSQLEQTSLDEPSTDKRPEEPAKIDSVQNSATSAEDSDSDSDGWITPSNLKKHQVKDASAATTQSSEPKTMQAAVLTTDFAMQNVILQMNLNLLSPSMHRVQHLKTFVLRCHACFQVTKEMSKQFCPRCGQPALTRVSCSTNANGEFKLHLKKNMQWNSRGDRFSIPKPVHGSSNGRISGGGKGGWGHDLILAEDQKEYERAVKTEKRQKERNLMDEDYLPSILTGDRGKNGGKVKVGAGRNVNARKR